ncbi:MAG: gamma-glutamylcyclotransferase [Akkermansiaceae bacterium]|nr:gamma-glutamylcyclotransferase [Akkermansiaceae bacterium]
MSELIFVYGALRKGASNDWRMKGARWLGPAEVAGTLVKVDWYPGLVLEGGSVVLGEVYEVGSELINELDEFEGIGLEDERNGEYHRVKAEVSFEGESLNVWIYEWLKGVEGYPVVESGDWLEA